MPSPSILSQMPLGCGDHLVLRLAGPQDAEALVEFNTRLFDDRFTGWTADLASGRHPTVQAGDFTVVEDTRNQKIVSSVCLVSQTWQYGGIPFQVGRPELVATDPDYRRRGLVRKQFQAIHARSAAKGELMQVITGIDWIYRQFGYEMGVKMWGSRCVDSMHLSRLKETNDCRMRPATPEDHAFIRNVYDQASRRELFTAVRSSEEWEYEFSGRSRDNTRRRDWLIVEDAKGERLGYVQYLPCIALSHMPMLRIYQIELNAGWGYLNIWPDLLDGLWKQGKAMFAEGILACEELQGLELALERDHPLYHAIPKSHLREIKPSPWYIRVPDMVAFLRRIRPELERHLIGTVAEGYSGGLKLNFFRGGIQISFERGRISKIETWHPNEVWEGDARFPDSSFLQLVCGWHRFHKMAESYADCWGTHEAAVLLDCLFPSYHGKVWVLA